MTLVNPSSSHLDELTAHRDTTTPEQTSISVQIALSPSLQKIVTGIIEDSLFYEVS